MTPDTAPEAHTPIPAAIADQLNSDEAIAVAAAAMEIAHVVKRLSDAPGRSGSILPAVPHRPAVST